MATTNDTISTRDGDTIRENWDDSIRQNLTVQIPSGFDSTIYAAFIEQHLGNLSNGPVILVSSAPDASGRFALTAIAPDSIFEAGSLQGWACIMRQEWAPNEPLISWKWETRSAMQFTFTALDTQRRITNAFHASAFGPAHEADSILRSFARDEEAAPHV